MPPPVRSPDYLPPNPAMGTGCELEKVFTDAQALGHLVMPYTNPTWWDPAAPTLQSRLPSEGFTMADVTCLNSSRLPMFETYPDVPPAKGVVTELAHPFVFHRWQQLMVQLTKAKVDAIGQWQPGEVCDEAQVHLPSDFIFEDQLGARHAYSDFNHRQGGMAALGYQQAIVDHAQNFSHLGLGTEQGFDKLARWEQGFYGHALEMEVSGSPRPYPFGHARGGWRLHPLSQMLFGATLTYNVHNLANTAFAMRLNNTCWAMTAGARLSMSAADLHYWGSKARWYYSVGLMQQKVISRFTGYPQSAFDRAGETSLTVMTSVFDNANPAIYDPSQGFSREYHIVGNWLPDDAAAAEVAPTVLPAGLPVEAFTLAPGGCAAFGLGGDIVGGWFSSYNHRKLAASSPSVAAAAALHSVIEDRTCGSGGGAVASSPTSPSGDVCVWHAVGADTMLDIRVPEGCNVPSTLVTAVSGNGTAKQVVSTPSSSAAGMVSFMAAAVVDNMQVDHFILHCHASGGDQKCHSACEQFCDASRHASRGDCFVCCGQHQRVLQASGCTDADFASFC